jgi:hypothetical protein
MPYKWWRTWGAQIKISINSGCLMWLNYLFILEEAIGTLKKSKTRASSCKKNGSMMFQSGSFALKSIIFMNDSHVFKASTTTKLLTGFYSLNLPLSSVSLHECFLDTDWLTDNRCRPGLSVTRGHSRQQPRFLQSTRTKFFYIFFDIFNLIC